MSSEGAGGMDGFPHMAYLQEFHGGLAPEGKMVKEVLEARGIPYATYNTEDVLASPLPLTRNDLVVGDFDWTRMAAEQLGVVLPDPPDYPACLERLLHRRIWESTLGEVAAAVAADGAEPFFIKPAKDGKAFSGLIATVDWMAYLREQFPASFPVLCSELVEIVAEYRVYVVHGAVRAVCQYKGPADAGLDLAVVNAAVATLAAADEGRHLTGCGIDFAVMVKDGERVTCLLEVNEGFSLGVYDGLAAEDYTDMLIARWHTLVGGGSDE